MDILKIVNFCLVLLCCSNKNSFSMVSVVLYYLHPQTTFPCHEWNPDQPWVTQPCLDYMAPEYCLTHSCCEASDMFSLGVLIYYVYNQGKPLYQCQNQLSQFRKFTEEVMVYFFISRAIHVLIHAVHLYIFACIYNCKIKSLIQQVCRQFHCVIKCLFSFTVKSDTLGNSNTFFIQCLLDQTRSCCGYISM